MAAAYKYSGKQFVAQEQQEWLLTSPGTWFPCKSFVPPNTFTCTGGLMINEMLFHKGERDHICPSCVLLCQEIIYKNERRYLINVGRHL